MLGDWALGFLGQCRVRDILSHGGLLSADGLYSHMWVVSFYCYGRISATQFARPRCQKTAFSDLSLECEKSEARTGNSNRSVCLRWYGLHRIILRRKSPTHSIPCVQVRIHAKQRENLSRRICVLIYGQELIQVIQQGLTRV